MDLKTDLKSARRDASNGISYEGIGPTWENSILEVVGNFELFFFPGSQISRKRTINILKTPRYVFPNTLRWNCNIVSIPKNARKQFAIIEELTQYYQRSPEHWDPQNGKYERGNRYMYGRLQIRTVDNMISNQVYRFQKRFHSYINTFSSNEAEKIRLCYNASRQKNCQALIPRNL